MAILEIGANEFTRGESYSEFLPTGGFSPKSYGLNLTQKIGALNFIESPTDRGAATLTGNIVASAYDNQSLGNDGYFVDENGAFYTISGSTFTKRQTAGGSADWTIGNVDMIQLRGGDTFATHEYDIVRLTGSNLATIDSTWWTATEGNSSLSLSVRHPLEVVEGTMYIGDQADIHTWDASSSVEDAISLPSGVNITSLRKHPDGRTLLAFAAETFNYTHTKGNGARVFYIDTVLQDWTREVRIEAQVEGTHVNGGVVYCTWGKNFGFFDGNGLVPLKRLETSGATYSQNIKSMEDTVMFRDGVDVLAYGDLGQGNVFWNIFRNTSTSQAINNIHYKGDNKMLYAYSDGAAGDLVEVDYDNVGQQGQFFTNRIDFKQMVHIHRVDLIHEVTNTAGTTNFVLSEVQLDGDETIISNKSQFQVGSTRTRIKTNIETDILQLKLVMSNDIIDFYGIRIFYDPIK